MKHKNVEEDVFNLNQVDLQHGILYHLEKWRGIQELGVEECGPWCGLVLMNTH